MLVFLATPVAAFRLGFVNTLSLPPTPVLVILSGYCGEDVEHEAVHCVEHAAGELVLCDEEVRRWQVERDDTNAPLPYLLFQPVPVRRRKAAEAINLFGQQNVARFGICQQAEQFGAVEGSTTFVLEVACRDTEVTVSRESQQVALGPAGILFGGRGPEVKSCKHGTSSI